MVLVARTPLAPRASLRRVKGVNLADIVKLLRIERKKRPITGFSEAAEALLSERILVSDWYSFGPFLELIEVTYREILGRNEESARQMGIVGGRMAFSGVHKHFVKPGNARKTLLAMRLLWGVYFDFGEVIAECDGPRAVRLAIDGYPEMPVSHGQLIVGWHTAAALEAGATVARSVVLEAPWLGGARLVHRVAF